MKKKMVPMTKAETAVPRVEMTKPYLKIDRIEESFVSKPEENKIRLRLIRWDIWTNSSLVRRGVRPKMGTVINPVRRRISAVGMRSPLFKKLLNTIGYKSKTPSAKNRFSSEILASVAGPTADNRAEERASKTLVLYIHRRMTFCPRRKISGDLYFHVEWFLGLKIVLILHLGGSNGSNRPSAEQWMLQAVQRMA